MSDEDEQPSSSRRPGGHRSKVDRAERWVQRHPKLTGLGVIVGRLIAALISKKLG